MDNEDGSNRGCGGDSDEVGVIVEKVSNPELQPPWEDHKLSPVT